MDKANENGTMEIEDIRIRAKNIALKDDCTVCNITKKHIGFD